MGAAGHAARDCEGRTCLGASDGCRVRVESVEYRSLRNLEGSYLKPVDSFRVGLQVSGWRKSCSLEGLVGVCCPKDNARSEGSTAAPLGASLLVI